MSIREAPPCTHDRAPGTTACLRCLREERIATGRRQRQALIQLGIGVGVAVVVAGIAVAAVEGAVGARSRGRGTGVGPTSMTGTSTRPVPTDSGHSEGISTAPTANVAMGAGADPTPAVGQSRVTTVPGSLAPMHPVIPTGRSELGDSVYAERTGDTVVVHFDLAMTRTRRPEKFQDILRTTLAQVYGDSAAPAMVDFANESAVDSAALVDDLPTRGLHLAVARGWTLSIYPETRLGVGGPLVVAYRAWIAAR